MTEMARELEGSRVVVTGGASGIGRATVDAFVELGALVCSMDLDGVSQDHMPAVRARQVDVSNEAQVEQAFGEVASEWGGIDVLVNAAGVTQGQMKDLREISVETWQTVMAVNLTGSFLTTRAASRYMIPAAQGVIILVGSHAGVQGGSGSVPYGASKGGVNGLAMTLQRHLAPHGIRVHNLAPGSVSTPLFSRSLEEAVGNGADASFREGALARAVGPQGIGRAIAFLASPQANDLRGTIFTQ